MNPRLVRTVLVIAFGLWVVGCSSGLGNDPRRRNGEVSTTATLNLPLGLDVGVPVSATIDEPVVAGVVVPAIGAVAARDVALVAFSTTAAGSENDGSGTSLSRDAVVDSNSAADVFAAIVVAQDIERRAFSQSLAGKFRHPRCVTCHSMKAADTLAFVSAAAVGQAHAGPAPGAGFPNNDPASCAPCHVTSTSFPVPGWMAPAASFDMRPKNITELATMARNVPVDDPTHFVSDPRVQWALSSGILPQVGGRNGVADDDHDGVDEPEDHDGVVRTVPGGSTGFLRDIDNWRATATPGVANSEVLTTKAAVKDITLVSRVSGTNIAGNGASSRPAVKYVANSAFNPANPTAAAIGTLFVAFQSEASNLLAGDTNGATDVYRASVELRAAADGSLHLLVLPTSTIVCSARNGTVSTVGNGASRKPSIGGADGEVIAFESLATNLIVGFTDGGVGADVYLRNVGSNGLGTTTLLVSHAIGNAATGGDGTSEAPAIAASGNAIAFESDATNLIASDANGLRDVFLATGVTSPFTKVRASVGAAGIESVGGASRAATAATVSGRSLVAFESDATNLAATTAPTNVFLFDSVLGSAQLLNQSVSSTATAIGNGSARAPAIGADGTLVAFESDANNIDVVRADTNGKGDVFVVETAQLALGRVLPFRISVTANEAAPANGASTQPRLGLLTGSTGFRVGIAAWTTAATNLGTSDNSKVMLAFLDETSGVIADFTTSPSVGAPPLEVQFTDRSSGTPTSWQWDFDNDGTTDSTVQNPKMTFTTPGIYTAKLTASNARSSGTKTTVAAFRVLGPCVADFTTSATNVAPTIAVNFTDTSTELPTSWSWDFGDSTTSSAQNPSHSYASVGTYSVSLTATGPGGSGSVTKTNLITVSFAPPNVTVIASQTTGVVPVTVNFSFSNVGGPIDVGGVSWSFGDPGSGVLNTSTSSTPSHTFNTAANFTVTLTVTGPGGPSVDTQGISVSAPTWTQVYTFFPAAGCLSCHTTPTSGGAPFSMVDQNTARANLVGVNSTTGLCQPTPRITAGNANLSTIVARVQGTSCGSTMSGLNSAQITALIAWINAGALNN